MTVTAMEIRTKDGAGRPTLDLDRWVQDALASYVARTLPPQGRRKAVEKLWDLTPDEARGVVEGKASFTTFQKVAKHKNGQWAVVLPVLGAVIPQHLDDFLAQQAGRSAIDGERYLADSRHLLKVGADFAASVGLGRRDRA